ncbi:O-antigen ligase family protein [Pistricoccus aurantiacus]|uniref:O-antigen ligase family protein n=1 Tax=Pistricoccus aurantiacus TaxID=1883414 RepID=UPI001FEABD67|nr:O-antigen ligase family protein [Pistricoccus aurantiacus]
MAGLLGYAALRMLWGEVGDLSGTLMAMLGLIAVLIYGRGIRSSAVLWLLLAALLVQTLSWGLGYLHHPEWVADNPQLDRLAKLFIFIAVAWWLGGSTRNTLLVWGIAVAGYLVASFTLGGGVAEWLRGLGGERVGFGVRNLQHGSMLFGVALIGVVIFTQRFVMSGMRVVWWRALIWLIVFGLCVTGVFIGQTRAVWLGTLTAFLVAGCLGSLWALMKSQGRHIAKPLLICLSVVLVVSLVAVLAFKKPLMARITQESQVVAQVLQGDVEQIPYTSIGTRINSWIAASEWIKQRPFVGWGSEGRALVMEHTAWLNPAVKAQYGHLHNFLLEIWVAYGVLGILVIMALATWIARGTWLAWRSGIIPNDIALFGISFFFYWVFVNQFESYNSFGTGVYVHNLVLGGLVTHIWRWQSMTDKNVFFTLGSRK